MQNYNSPRRRRLLRTVSGFWDLRVLILLILCAVVGMHTDPAATLGLAEYLVYVVGIWGAALLITKVIMPYVELSVAVDKAVNDGNRAAATVIVARVCLIIAVALTLIMWGK